MKFQQKKRALEKSEFSASNIILMIAVFIWFLAVVKIFLLEYHNKTGVDVSKVVSFPSVTTTTDSKQQQSIQLDQYQATNRLLKASSSLSSINSNHVTPNINDWQFIRSSIGHQSYNRMENHPVDLPKILIPGQALQVESPNMIGQVAASELKWPAVLPDNSVPNGDGFDVMPFSELKVPRFWEAKGDVIKSGFKVGGEDTIFLMIASYRDFQCRETITSAFKKADHPERLFVGAVDQLVPGDIGCLDIDIPCSQDNTQAICKYRDQIVIYKMDAAQATGPVTARHIGDRLYRGQTFVMQLDAHCLFVRHWDSLIIKQWQDTKNEMAVLSSYLTDVQDSIDGNGDSTRNTRPIMCNSDYEGMMPARYLRHGAQPEEEPVIREGPQLQPFWAAGFSFSRGHFKVQVPYDAYQPMVFQGEEIAIGIRGFTYGYDFYAPRDSVVFHEYAVKSNRRKSVHMFWENNKYAGAGQKSIKRATAIIGMAPDLDASSYDHTDENKYGLGKGMFFLRDVD